MKLVDFQKKLGVDIPGRFLVFNHNPYENCDYLGETSRGTPAYVNSEFMACDLKLSIGCILPHPTAGFGGGGKMILPGIAHVDSITANHRNLCTSSESGGMALDAWGRVDALTFAESELYWTISLRFSPEAGDKCAIRQAPAAEKQRQQGLDHQFRIEGRGL